MQAGGTYLKVNEWPAKKNVKGQHEFRYIYIIGLSVSNKNVCFITCVCGLYYYEFCFSENHKRSIEKFEMI